MHHRTGINPARRRLGHEVLLNICRKSALFSPWTASCPFRAALDAEVRGHDASLGQLTQSLAPALLQAHGMGTGTAAEMLILVGDNPERIHSEAALAKLCGACPAPAFSGKTTRHRLNRGGNRQANAALYRVVIVRMRAHQPTLDYVRRRTVEGKSKPEIIRCLKRYVAREIFGYLCRPTPPLQVAIATP
ncbi:IS110 family transposase [Muricoccus nepalensis]|uniref:IS110 family transposase n=1 Tax=Muricoccus nepalensis TaxID=1854500 RepID=UPI00240E81F7|nr:IS110 family transposase [Roseomonas nepalensis]